MKTDIQITTYRSLAEPMAWTQRSQLPEQITDSILLKDWIAEKKKKLGNETQKNEKENKQV